MRLLRENAQRLEFFGFVEVTVLSQTDKVLGASSWAAVRHFPLAGLGLLSMKCCTISRTSLHWCALNASAPIESSEYISQGWKFFQITTVRTLGASRRYFAAGHEAEIDRQNDRAGICADTRTLEHGTIHCENVPQLWAEIFLALLLIDAYSC